MSDETPRLGLPFIVENETTAYLTHNAALTDLDVLVQGVLISQANDPPVDPDDGDMYLVGSVPTGAWVGYAQKIAYYSEGWVFITPQVGFTFWVEASGGSFLVCTDTSPLTWSNLIDILANNLVAKSLFDANTLLFATSDNTPVAVAIGTNEVVARVGSAALDGIALTASTVLGRAAAGDIAAIDAAGLRTIIGNASTGTKGVVNQAAVDADMSCASGSASDTIGPATNVDLLTDSTGGTTDNTVAACTVTDSTGGTADGTLQALPDTTGVTQFNSVVRPVIHNNYSDLAAALTTVNNNIAELTAELITQRTLNALLIDAIKSIVTDVNGLKDKMRTAGLLASS